MDSLQINETSAEEHIRIDSALWGSRQHLHLRTDTKQPPMSAVLVGMETIVCAHFMKIVGGNFGTFHGFIG